MKSKLLLLALTFCFIFTGLSVNAQSGDISELRLSKSFTGESIESTKTFSVGENYTLMTIELLGRVKTGSIVVSLIKPNGDMFKTIEIDPTADVDFEQMFNLEENRTEWTGDWQLKIKADKAEGTYKLTIETM